jgi:hypothetical protein
LRIWARSANGGGANDGVIPCGTFGYGNYADYTAAIVNNATCLPPSGLTATALATSASLSWTASTSTPLNYRWKVVSNGSNAAADTGIISSGYTAGITATATGLSALTNYQVYVKSICSATDSSVWTLATNISTPCNGLPAGGTATSSPTSVCPTTSFSLLLTGAGSGTGITYQWQSSPTGAGTFANIASANAITYTSTQAVATDYRCIVKCTTTGDSAISAITTVLENAPNTCYCIPTNTNVSYYISSFSTTGGTTNITNNGTGSGAYNDYSATMTAAAVQGNTVNFSLTGSSAFESRAIYVDWNQDGDFVDAGELVYSSASTSSATVTGSFAVPFSATAGNTRMRVRTTYYSGYTMAPCGLLYYGESEDYKFTVTAVTGVCVYPVNLGITAITNSTATGNFSAPPAGNTPTNYIYELRTNGAAGSGAVGLIQGGTVTASPILFTGLAQGYGYTLYARTFCSAGDTSVWTSVSFNTTFDTLTPVPLAGFNYDVIANGVGPANTSANNDVDGASFSLVSIDFHAAASNANLTYGLPVNGVIQNGLRKYQLNAYTSSNSLRMPYSTGTTGVVRFLTPKQANKIYVMGVSGSGASNWTTTVYFHDGTTQSQVQGWPDWFTSSNGVGSPNAVNTFSIGRISYNSSTTYANTTSGGPYLLDTGIVIAAANRAKQIDSVGFATFGTVTPARIMNVLAVSIVPNTNQTCTLPLAIDSVGSISATGGTLAWRANASNTNYQLSYGLQGTYAQAGTLISVTGSGAISTPLSSLTPATGYQVFIRSDCGSGSYSDWIGPINFTTLGTNCNGAPAAATLVSSVASTCASTAYTLTASNVSFNNGVSLKWQSSPTGLNTWTTLSTVTPTIGTSTYIYSVASQSASTDYRCILGCSFTGDSSVSSVVTVAQNPFNNCYCTSTATNANYFITKFQTVGAAVDVNKTSAGGTTVTGYSNYTTTDTIKAITNTTINFNGLTTDNGVKIWVDWNHDGDFDDAGEQMYQTGAYVASFSGSFLVPTTALTGYTRLRVKADYNATLPTACGNITYGETEDYAFFVIAQTPCAGAPAPGATNASVTSLCVTGTTALSVANNYLTSSGIKYQWQSSTDLVSWANIANDTTVTVTSPTITQTTNFRLRMICTAGPDTGYSTPVAVVVHALPTIAVTPNLGAFCTSGSATLAASGASTYAWSPSATLSAATGASVVATPTVITTYTVTGTDIYNCVNTTTATVGPINAFTPTATATNVCTSNLPVAITVAPITSIGGNTEYKITDTLGATIADWQSSTSFTVTPATTGGYKYNVYARNTGCPTNTTIAGIVTFYVGFGGNVIVNNATCANGNGSLVISGVQGPGSGNAVASWYSNDFSSTTLDTNIAVLRGTASFLSGALQLTPNTASTNGGILIKNPNAIPKLDSVTFNLTIPTAGADGFSWNYGDNVAYANNAAGNYELGVGDKLIVSFDSYSGSGTLGIHLTYGQTNYSGLGNTVTSTMLAYTSSLTWRPATNSAVSISISSDNKLTLRMGTTVIFNAVQLPAAFANANKATWQQLIAARTGGVSEQHLIDNLGVYYTAPGFSYGSSPANSGTVPTTWQSSPVFSGLNGGDSLDLWVANPSNTAGCNKKLGTFGVTAPVMTTFMGSGDPSCAGLADGYVYLNVNAQGTYSASFNKNGGATATVGGFITQLATPDTALIVYLPQGTYTNFRVITSGSCASSPITTPIVLTAPVANTISMVSSTSDSLNQPGTGTQYYTDSLCNLITAVTSSNNLGVVAASLNIATTAPSTTAGEPFLKRYMVITPSQNSTLPATVKLYYSPADFTAYNALPAVGNSSYPAILSDGSNLRIRAFHGLPSSGTTGPNGTYNLANSDVLQPISTVYNATGGYWEVTVASPNGFSGFFANTTTVTPLVINLGDISAVNKGNVNVVSWNTKTETAGDRFSIERSTDGRAFSAIATMAAKGYAPSNYTYTDEKPFNGINYYRLILLNVDGSKDVSKVVSATVKNSASFQLAAYPNPATSELTVNVTAVNGKGTVEIVDVTGRTLISKEVSGATTVVSLSGLVDGMYVIKYHDDVNEGTMKVNKN